MEKRPRVNPVLVLAFGVLAISSGSILARFAQETAPSLVIAAWRLSLATLILAPLALTRDRGVLRALRRDELALAVLSGVFLALHFATWITSLEYTTVASSVVLVTTTPLWVALASPFFLKEPITRPILVGMILALLGGVMIGLSDTCAWGAGGLVCPGLDEMVHGRAFLGDILAVAGAMFAAAYVIIGRKLRSNVTLLSYIFLVYGMAAVILVGLMLGAGEHPFGYPPTTYVFFLLLAIFPQLLGHSSFNWALKYVSAAYVSITLLGEPIGATILAYFLLGEAPTTMNVFGAILILTGIFIASRVEVKQDNPSRSPVSS
jgi:drug/metabolite transporter (DMT)-like permease